MSAPLRLGLVGTGIGHSLSPRLHTAALEITELAGTYDLFDCADAAAATAVFEQLRRGELDGLNVTTPFKALALASADGWLRTAHHQAGVFTHPANTLFMKENRLIAASTDGFGLTGALLSGQVDLVGKRVLLLGAGGAGQAIAADILALGAAQLRIANRSVDSAAALVARLNAIWPRRVLAHAWGESHGLAGVDVVVHATRLGHGQTATQEALAAMAAHLDWLPWRAWAERMPVLADLVYADGLTPLQALALSRGLPVDDRLDARTPFQQRPPKGVLRYFGQTMLAHQAARAFEIWTGHRVDAQQMLAAIVA